MGDFLNHVGHEFTLGNVDSGAPVSIQSKTPDSTGPNGEFVPGQPMTVTHQLQRPTFLSAFLSNLPSAIPLGVENSMRPGGGVATGIAGGLQGIQQNKVLQQSLASQQAEANLKNEQAKRLSSQITLPDGTTLPSTMYPAWLAAHTKQNIADQSNRTKLQLGGYDANNKPLPLDQLSIPQQTKTDIAQAQQELTKARISAMNADVTTPAGRVAYQKLLLAQQNAASQSTRAAAAMKQAGIASEKYLGDYFGVDSSGKTLPGVDPDDPQGLKIASMFKPTGTQRTRSDLAVMVQNSNEKMKEIINRHPELFGPGAGQVTGLTDLLGTLGPDAAEFETYLGSSAAANAGVHQFRSYNAADHFKHILSGGSTFGRNVTGLLAGIDADTQAVESMRKAGAMPAANKPNSSTPKPIKIIRDANGRISGVE